MTHFQGQHDSLACHPPTFHPPCLPFKKEYPHRERAANERERDPGKNGEEEGPFQRVRQVVFRDLNRAADIKRQLRLIEPETLLQWQRILTKRFWTFEHRPAKRGRKPVDTDVKDLILSMKIDNLLWGVKRSRASC